MGTAPIAVPSLEKLIKTPGMEVVAVVTQPDRPRGRDLKLQPSAVKTAALLLNLPILQPERIRDAQSVAALSALKPEVIVVVAYGQILPETLLQIPSKGCLNIHTSLLPKYRGAAPIQWALWNGETQTGVTLMKMDAGLDTGPMISRATTQITAEDNALVLHDRLAVMGAQLLADSLPKYLRGEMPLLPQPADQASHARKIMKEDGRIDWNQPAVALWNQVRALIPWPGTFTCFRDDAGVQKLIKIWKASYVSGKSGPPGTILETGSPGMLVAAGSDALLVTELQSEGGKRLPAEIFLRGHPLRTGQLLGSL